MDQSTNYRNSALRNKQTDQLFNGLQYSALGTVILALTMVIIIGPKSSPLAAWTWFATILLISIYRWMTAMVYLKIGNERRYSPAWRIRFEWATYTAAVTWGLSMWIYYPVDDPPYQVLMILGLAGVAGGANAVLSFSRKTLTVFLVIMMLGIESRLLWQGGELSYQLAFLLLVYFIFLIKGGRDIGNSFLELLTLRQNNEDYNLTLLSTTERLARIGYWQWDMKSNQLELSQNLASMCGASSRHVALDFCLKKVHEDDRGRVEMALDNTCATGQENSVEYRIKEAESNDWVIMNQVIKRIKDNSGNHSILGTVQDISLIKSAEQKIFDMAYYDELTGLANRGHFREQLKEQIKHATRNQLQLAILYIDLDGFKEINDSLGHGKGDIFLQAFSRQLKQVVREEDFVARLGGDEFCIILGDIADGMSSVKTAERCLGLRNNPIRLDHQMVTPQMSIGIAVYPEDGDDVESLLRAADAAMYSAKSRGKHCFAFYDRQMTLNAAKRLQLEADLREALKNDEFSLVYQPKVCLDSGVITGVEALIRWHHPQRGLVAPDEFISTAERIGLINDVGEWVLDTACRQLEEWKNQGLVLDMAINVSSSHFSADHFFEKVLETKRLYQLRDGELEIEITESMSRDASKHIDVCRQLHRAGIKVAIDDFGTGYSSLSILKQLEVDTLKIDRSFIQHLPEDKASAMMVTAIVKMATGLGFEIVAEGVETQQQAAFLKKLRSAYVQGYYYSQPVRPEEIPRLADSLKCIEDTGLIEIPVLP